MTRARPTLKNTLYGGNKLWNLNEAMTLAKKGGFDYVSWNDRVLYIDTKEMELSNNRNPDGTRTVVITPYFVSESTELFWSDLEHA